MTGPKYRLELDRKCKKTKLYLLRTITESVAKLEHQKTVKKPKPRAWQKPV